MKISTVTEIPEFHPQGRWAELIAAAEKMVLGQVIRVELDNQEEAKSAQTNLQAGEGKGTHRNTLKGRGYRFITRTRPVNGNKAGQWFLFVKRTQ